MAEVAGMVYKAEHQDGTFGPWRGPSQTEQIALPVLAEPGMNPVSMPSNAWIEGSGVGVLGIVQGEREEVTDINPKVPTAFPFLGQVALQILNWPEYMNFFPATSEKVMSYMDQTKIGE